MARKKGTQKTGGRSKGTPNKTTQELRDSLHLFIEDNLDSLQGDFEAITDKDKKLAFFEKIIRLVLPPPINPDSLSESQLIQVLDYLKKQQNEKINN